MGATDEFGSLRSRCPHESLPTASLMDGDGAALLDRRSRGRKRSRVPSLEFWQPLAGPGWAEECRGRL